MAEVYFYTSEKPIEVIQCKDCKYYGPNTGIGLCQCLYRRYTTHALPSECVVQDDYFCNFAERKEND